MPLVRTLMDCDDRTQTQTAPALTPGLAELYGGDLNFDAPTADRPFVFANFVSTLDGVVSYNIKDQASGSTISGSDPADRFIMGLLRASADAVIVGAQTVRAVSPQSLWTPESTYPNAEHLFTEYRQSILGKSDPPLLVVVSSSGKLELGRAIFQTPAAPTVVITTSAGKGELVKAGATKLPSVQIHAIDAANDAADGKITPQAILRLLQTELGVRTLLHEGGPTLFGQFLAAQAVDELFLTVSPQIAGRSSGAPRPALVQGTEFTPQSAPWFRLLSVKQSAEHLYLRYRRSNAL